MPIDNDASCIRPSTATYVNGGLRPAASRLFLLPSNRLIYRASKGRGGKVVTLVKNLQLSTDDHKALTKHLKQTCGSGERSKTA